MAADDLNTPLGHGPKRPRARRFIPVAIGATCLLAVSTAATTAWLSGDPKGGEPFAVASIATPNPITTVPQRRESPGAATEKTAVEQPTSTVENGITIYRANQVAPAAPTGPLIIKVPEALGQNEVAPVDPCLIEAGRYGPLPRIGTDGARPGDVYARPSVFSGAGAPGAPRFAVVIANLRADDPNAVRLAASLPAAATLAFLPYGDHLQDSVTMAKAAGHEVLLELPVATSDPTPGPHALLAQSTAHRTIDDLHWLLSRMTGYVGLAMIKGGAIAADKTAMMTLVNETARRGLLLVGDESSPRFAPSASVELQTAHADLTLAAGTDALGARDALEKLEARARAKGAVLLVVDGRSDLVARVGDVLSGLGARGITLVPASALAVAGSPTMAAAQ